MTWTRGSNSPRPSKLRAPRAHDVDDSYGAPPDGAWVNDDEDALGDDESSEAGGVSLIDGDLDRYRNDERRDS